jgi:hypothetical protein
VFIEPLLSKGLSKSVTILCVNYGQVHFERTPCNEEEKNEHKSLFYLVAAKLIADLFNTLINIRTNISYHITY